MDGYILKKALFFANENEEALNLFNIIKKTGQLK